MDFVKKCKRVLGSNKNSYCHHEDTSSSGKYGKLSEKQRPKKKEKPEVAPQGCLAVYVGPERQRFVIKIKHANHPLFKILLEAAENEYGHRNDGPLWLPCDVDLFCEALLEMECPKDDPGSVGCTLPKGHSSSYSSSISYSPLSCHSNLSYED
ncbi:hypothetical protein TanjilG_27503 [Lupinus angustifolius]|uniref:Uncharacterized protein n=1 Tax=Lupinus angustifolius TaxID=3871 RepID=A0A4P1R2Z8_LUPAN|nr:PREDICTED: auxin-responsive protein SAUR71-like [Lupinus angustifolius]OIW00252.1 hypothetical protein TanjilG_27503 [Lupinus angustifolius]